MHQTCTQRFSHQSHTCSCSSSSGDVTCILYIQTSVSAFTPRCDVAVLPGTLGTALGVPCGPERTSKGTIRSNTSAPRSTATRSPSIGGRSMSAWWGHFFFSLGISSFMWGRFSFSTVQALSTACRSRLLKFPSGYRRATIVHWNHLISATSERRSEQVLPISSMAYVEISDLFP